MAARSDIEAAQEVHHRFEFYLVAVAFTIAAFAMQTGEFSGNLLGDAAEVSSWVSLTISGLLGLWRLEYIPVMYRANDFVDRKNEAIRTFSANPENAESVAILKRQVAETEPKLKGMESSNYRKYFWQKFLFVVGLISLLVARFVGQMTEWYW